MNFPQIPDAEDKAPDWQGEYDARYNAMPRFLKILVDSQQLQLEPDIGPNGIFAWSFVAKPTIVPFSIKIHHRPRPIRHVAALANRAQRIRGGSSWASSLWATRQ